MFAEEAGRDDRRFVRGGCCNDLGRENVHMPSLQENVSVYAAKMAV
jgi:hypothetical protein